MFILITTFRGVGMVGKVGALDQRDLVLITYKLVDFH